MSSIAREERAAVRASLMLYYFSGSVPFRTRRATTANGDRDGAIIYLVQNRGCYPNGIENTYLLLFDEGVYNTRVEGIGPDVV